jgi:DNA-directed RNA polymerase specialized sigma24 family protein
MAQRFDDDEDSVESKTAEHLERLEDDQEIVARLRREGFVGPVWNKLSRALVEYAYPCVRGWVVSGQIIKVCQDKRIPLRRGILGQMENEDAEELTQAIVAEGILKFQKLLCEDRWSPSRGASLTTYFVGQCVICFPNQYRAWLSSKRPPWWEPLPESDDQDFRRDCMPDPTDPARAAENKIHLQEVAKHIDPLTLHAIVLQDMGFRVAEIADELNKTPKAIEMLLYHHRRRTRGKGETE